MVTGFISNARNVPPQQNTRVGKSPRALPLWTGGPNEASHAWNRVTETLPGLGHGPKRGAVEEMWWAMGAVPGDDMKRVQMF